MKEEFDFESIKNKAIEQLKADKPFCSKNGAFVPLLESILNAALKLNIGFMIVSISTVSLMLSMISYFNL